MAYIERFQYVVLHRDSINEQPKTHLCMDEKQASEFCRLHCKGERIVYSLDDVSPRSELSNYKRLYW